jgi:hypothetical protein
VEISAEHPLSKASFKGPQVSIAGLPFCGGQTVVIPRNRFKSNILCRVHNNGLSVVDEAGVRAMETLEAALEGTERRPKRKIQGDLFERWLLKTLINFELLADFNRRLPRTVVEMAFGVRPFGERAGLFLDASIGDALQTPDGHFRYTPLMAEEDGSAKLAGGKFSVGGFNFLLMFCNLLCSEQPPPTPVARASTSIDPLRRPRRINFASDTKQYFIAFSWHSS